MGSRGLKMWVKTELLLGFFGFQVHRLCKQRWGQVVWRWWGGAYNVIAVVGVGVLRLLVQSKSSGFLGPKVWNQAARAGFWERPLEMASRENDGGRWWGCGVWWLFIGGLGGHSMAQVGTGVLRPKKPKTWGPLGLGPWGCTNRKWLTGGNEGSWVEWCMPSGGGGGAVFALCKQGRWVSKVWKVSRWAQF